MDNRSSAPSPPSPFAIATRPPRGRLKRVLRVPVVLQRRGLGWIFGQRILIIEHRGRRTGKQYRTPVEVVAHDGAVASWTVVAAWGGRPEWFANIQANAASAVFVAGHRYDAPAQHLVDHDTNAEGRRLPGRFRTREPAPDDVNHERYMPRA